MHMRPCGIGYLVALGIAVTCVAASPSFIPREDIHLRPAAPSVGTDSFDGDEFSDVILSKRADLCAGVNLRSKSRLTGSIINAGDCSAAMTTNGVGGSYFFTPGDQVAEKITSRTDLNRDTKVKLITDRKKNFKKTCDHVLQINILQAVLKETGACAAAEQLTNPVAWTATDGKNQVTITVTDGQRRILMIRNVIMRPQNLISLQSRVEHMKTLATQRFEGIGKKNAWDVGSKLDFLAMTDFVLAKTVQKSQATAVLLDTEIANQFPGNRGGVAAKLTAYLAYMLVQKRLVMQLAAQELRNEQCKLAVIKAPTPRPVRMVRRHLHSDDFDRAPGFSVLPLSSLERRARGAAPRSGKKAPGNPSCPCKQQPKKAHVPQNQAKKRPPPATKPRQPAQRPAARPPAKRQVAKRPASRPRRTPGKAQTPRPTTPRRKPKVVPKPTRRPKGNARRRRRRK